MKLFLVLAAVILVFLASGSVEGSETLPNPVSTPAVQVTDPRVWAAWITGGFVLGGGILTLIIGLLRWKLDSRHVEHEEKQWLLELHSRFEAELFAARLRTYPAVLAKLEALSRHRVESLSPSQASQLADDLNGIGYGEAGLCMTPDTREAVFELRDRLMHFVSGQMQASDLANGPRTDLIEGLRRDLNHGWSFWRPQMPPLLEDILRSAPGSRVAAPDETKAI